MTGAGPIPSQASAPPGVGFLLDRLFIRPVPLAATLREERAIDGLLSQQVDLDIESLQKATGRAFTDAERADIRENTQRAYRWTFLVSGLQHHNFVQVVRELTEGGEGKIGAAAKSLSA